MKFSRHLLVVMSTTLIGATSASWVEVGCGCDNYNESIASTLGTDPAKDELSDPAKVLAAIQKRFVGAEVSPKKLSESNVGDVARECAYEPGHKIVCTYWLWEKPGAMKALVITVSYGQHSRYETAQVSYRQKQDRSGQ